MSLASLGTPFFPMGKNWWTRLQPIRTAWEIAARISIKPTQQAPLYQRIAPKVTQLRLLGMSYNQIGQALHVSPSLARKADRFGRRSPLDELDLDFFAEGVGELDERTQREAAVPGTLEP